MAEKYAGEHYAFSVLGPEADGWYDRRADKIVLGYRAGVNRSAVAGASGLIDRRDLHLLGDHNVANALAAAIAVIVADDAHRSPDALERIRAGLKSFRALPHRMEIVGEYNGVQWINDSKATNVDSAKVAIAGMTRPTVLLLGGKHKGEPYTSLAVDIRAHVKAVIAYGEAAELVENDLRGVVPIERLGSSFEAVVARARALAVPGDAVLLSPACSSYDMFDNYEVRGAEFRRLAASR
jgi:UDP-N-acetylmuramoylalanine--D-glutamate ligase